MLEIHKPEIKTSCILPSKRDRQPAIPACTYPTTQNRQRKLVWPHPGRQVSRDGRAVLLSFWSTDFVSKGITVPSSILMNRTEETVVNCTGFKLVTKTSCWFG